VSIEIPTKAFRGDRFVASQAADFAETFWEIGPPKRGGTGWLGRKDSNSRIQRLEAPLGQDFITTEGDRRAIFIAETTGLPLQMERQCRRADKGPLDLLGSRPAGDTATVGLRW